MKETTSDCYKTTKDKSELKRERERESSFFSQFDVWGYGERTKKWHRDLFPPKITDTSRVLIVQA